MSDEDRDDDALPDPEDVIAGYDPDKDDNEQEFGDDLPDADRIIQIHDRVVNEYDLTHTGTRVAAPRLKFRKMLAEVDEYEGEYRRAAALLRKIITSHYFEDGNKRTGWLTTRQYLDDRGHVPAERDAEHVERVAKSVRSFDVDELAMWLAHGDIDKEKLNPR